MSIHLTPEGAVLMRYAVAVVALYMAVHLARAVGRSRAARQELQRRATR